MSGQQSQIFERTIPDFAAPSLVRLYGHLFSSLSLVKLHHPLLDIHTYVAGPCENPEVVLLFAVEGDTARVLHEQFAVEAAEIDRFARHVLERYPAVSRIILNAIEVGRSQGNIMLPHNTANCSEDIVVSLPETVNEYDARLGKSTRKNLKHHLSRFKREMPTMKHQIITTENIVESDLREVVRLNQLRMQVKGKDFSTDESEILRLISLARECGFLNIVTIDGRICAGAICYRIGDNFFSMVNAHDPAYDRYRLGSLICYLTVCEAIGHGGREFHFMWGRDQYKFQLLGVRKDLDKVTLYRSRLQQLRHFHRVLEDSLREKERKLRFELIERAKAGNDSFVGRWLGRAKALVRGRHRLHESG